VTTTSPAAAVAAVARGEPAGVVPAPAGQTGLVPAAAAPPATGATLASSALPITSAPAVTSAPVTAKRRHRAGTAARLIAFHLAVLGVVIAVVVVALAYQLSASYDQIAGRNLASELHSFAANVPAPPLPATSSHPGRGAGAGTGGGAGAAGSAPVSSTAAARRAGCELLQSAARYFRGHALPAGTVLAVGVASCRSPAGPVVASGSVPLVEAVLAAPAVGRAVAQPPGGSLLASDHSKGYQFELLSSPIREGRRVIGSFIAAEDMAGLLADRARVVRLSVAEGAVALLAAVLGAWFILRRLLRTVGRITTAAEEIERGEIDRRLGDQGTDDEVGRLAVTFDRMLDRIASAMTTQRRLLSDVSHQLRTPLTVARGHLEVLQRTGTGDRSAVEETVSLVLDELDHMRALVERLLLLGRAMEPDFLAVEAIDLRSFVADLYATSQVLAERRFLTAPVPDVVVHADEAKLRGAVLNLIDNAVKATVAGDSVGLSARLEPASGDLLINVDDSGPGIDPSQRAAALARFQRPGARDAGGSGLGLAIVKAVAEAHGGRLDLSDSPIGGCRASIRLPASAVSSGGVAV
jgi:signal transduction histidine kinase